MDNILNVGSLVNSSCGYTGMQNADCNPQLTVEEFQSALDGGTSITYDMRIGLCGYTGIEGMPLAAPITQNIPAIPDIPVLPEISPRERIDTYIVAMMQLIEDNTVNHGQIDRCLTVLGKDIATRLSIKPLMITRANRPPDLQFALTCASGEKTYDLLPCDGIGAIIASPGSGKSACIGAIASALENPTSDGWGFRLNTKKKMAIIDTEQDQVTLWRNVERICRRAHIEELTRVAVASTVSLSLSDKISYVLAMIASPEYDLIVIDGIGDLVMDVNSPKECNEIVQRITQCAAQYHTGVLVTLHDNPVQNKSAYYGKSRGHLGSEITRRADFSLYIKYNTQDKLYKLSADAVSGKCRHCCNDLELYFKWDDAQKMHVSADAPTNDQVSLEKELTYIKELLSIRENWSTSQLVEHLMQTEGIKENMAKKRISYLNDSMILVKIKHGYYAVNGALISESIDISQITLD
jgi:hypothetical protein